MTFTKEKLERVRATVDCSTILLAHSGNNQPHPLPEGWHHAYTPMDSDEFRRFVIEAATALPHYITALAEAERALEQYEMALNEAADDYNKIEKVCLQHGLMSSHREAIETAAYIRAMLHSHSKALTTIRGLARGNADAT